MKKLITVLVALAVLAAAPAVKHVQLTFSDGESEFPAVAFTGAGLGVAWMDGRDGNQEIYYAAVDLDSGQRGPERRITASADWDDHPSLAWTGNEFGLCWIHEARNKFGLMFAKVGPEGSVRLAPRYLFRQSMIGKDTAMYYTGAGFGIVTTEFRGSLERGELVYRFMDDAGNQQGEPITLSGGVGDKVPAALLRVGSDFVVVYLDSAAGSVNYLKFNPVGGAPGQPVQLNLPGTRCGLPAADHGEKGTVVAWAQETQSGKQVMAVIISDQGQVMGDPRALTQPGADRPAVAAAAGPSGFGVAWIELSAQGRALYFMPLAETGQMGDLIQLSQPRPIRIMSHRLTMCRDRAGYVIAWVDLSPPMNTEIILSRVGF